MFHDESNIWSMKINDEETLLFSLKEILNIFQLFFANSPTVKRKSMHKPTKQYETPQVPFEYTLEEIADKLDISKERVRQIEYQAIRKMRLHGKALKGYLHA